MQAPNADSLRFAAEWLRQYDDTHDGGEQTAIAEKVADWLDAKADAAELRAVAREHGVPVGKLRQRLRARRNPQPPAQTIDGYNVEFPGAKPARAGEDY